MGQYERDRNYIAAEKHFQVTSLAASVAPKTPKYTFHVDSEETILRFDPEYADFDNPRGEVYATRYFMVATDEDGRQVRYGWETSEIKAERVFQYFAPAVSEWSYFRCVYGSLAYEQNGCELQTLQDEIESELGPDWRNHPQVRHYPAHVLMS